MSLSDCIWPSRSIVARTCSEPGVTKNVHGSLEPVGLCLLGDVRGAAHILVGRIRTAADQGGRDFVDKTVVRVGHLGGEREIGARSVGGMRADHIGLQLGQIELDHTVVVFRRVGLDLFVRLQQRWFCWTSGTRAALPRRPQIFGHALVSREERCGGAELGPHIGDRRLACGT